MATFEDIQKANKQIQTTEIKGKEYAEVNQRIKAFRMVYPEGFITTDLLSNENGVCVFQAAVGYYTEDADGFANRKVLGTGTAYEKESSSFINKTSYIENCETSAVGRALGMAGFGIDTSVASYEEVETAMANQDANKTISKLQVKTLKDMADKYDQKISDICRTYKIDRLEDMTSAQFGAALKVFKDLEKKNG